jgi:Leucine-rich repeat (LRR) protein
MREDALLCTVSDEFRDGYVYQASSVTLNMSGASRESSLDTLKLLVHRYPGIWRLRIEELQQRDEDAVFDVLKTMRSLQTLEVTNCNTGISPVKLSKVLTNQLTSLTSLNLTGNEFEAAGATALAPALTNLTSLTTLDVSANNFDDVTALAPALMNLTSLTTLDLSHNEFGADGATALAPALTNLTSLTTLDLSWNEFEAAGATLAPALTNLTSLTTLNLSYNWLEAGVRIYVPARRLGQRTCTCTARR